MPEHDQICQPPTQSQSVTDTVFRRLCYGLAWLFVLLITFIVLRIATAALPALRQEGLGFLTGTTWDPKQGRFGILPKSGGPRIARCWPFHWHRFRLTAAIFLSEGYLASFVFRILRVFRVHFHPVWGTLPDRLEQLLKNLIELLAAIPSVVYGLWGLFVVIPLVRPACNWLHLKLGWIPFFGTTLSGPGMLPAALVLSSLIFHHHCHQP